MQFDSRVAGLKMWVQNAMPIDFFFHTAI